MSLDTFIDESLELRDLADQKRAERQPNGNSLPGNR